MIRSMLMNRSSREQNSALELAAGTEEDVVVVVCVVAACPVGAEVCGVVGRVAEVLVVVHSSRRSMRFAASRPEARPPFEVRFGLRLNIIGVDCLLLLETADAAAGAVVVAVVAAANDDPRWTACCSLVRTGKQCSAPEGNASEGVIMAVEGERDDRASSA